MARALEYISKRGGDLSHAGFMRIAPPHQHMPGLGFEQANGMFDEGGFSGPVWPQDSDNVAAQDIQVDAVQNLGAAFVIEGNMLKPNQRFGHSAHAFRSRQNFQFCRSQIPRSSFDNDRRGEFDFVVINHLLQAFQRADILDLPIGHEHDSFRPDAQHILNSVLNHQNSHAFIRQPADHVEGLVGRGRIQAGQRFIEQQDGRAHGQHPCQGHFLLFPSRKVKCFPVAQVSNIEIAQALIYPADYLRARHGQVFQPKRHFMQYFCSQNLALWILQDSTNRLGDFR